MQNHQRDAPTPRLSSDDSRSTHSRREFMGMLTTGSVASAGVAETASAQEIPVVSMGNDYFDPVGLFVEPGTTVRFEIESGSHSVTAYEDRIPTETTTFDSGVFSEGGFEQTFETPGTYDYYCRPHRSMGMVGRIVVGEPGGPAEDGPIPDGSVPDSETIVEQGAVTIDQFDGSESDDGGGMMRSGQGMMDDGGPGWMMLLPIGFLTAVIGLVGGVVYWAAGRGKSETKGDDSAMATLRKQYARGDIDEAEYTERERRLQEEDQRGE